MAKIRITKEFQFEMAHALWNYDGKCKNIHGHTYIMYVTVSGEPIDDPQNPKNGMVMDFGDLKKIVKENIIDTHDHFLAINKNSPHNEIKFEDYNIDQIQRKNYQPTCENMVVEFAEIIKSKLPENIYLESVKLYETQTSSAEWFAIENEEMNLFRRKYKKLKIPISTNQQSNNSTLEQPGNLTI
ncbi:MAG TPA: 6-carboxytetrahydropterin synthase [Bacteroidetes bacterium]|nr:6-carboxytetrahydropterin synthase [Bacteroidota bacterium]